MNLMLYGAQYARQPSSVAKVCYWYIPGGCDYVNAQAVEIFFDDLSLAEKLAKRYSDQPEMAMCIPLESVATT